MGLMNYLRGLYRCLKTPFIEEIRIRHVLRDELEVICIPRRLGNTYGVRRIIEAIDDNGDKIYLILHSSRFKSIHTPKEYDRESLRKLLLNSRKTEELRKVNIPTKLEVDRIFKTYIGPFYYLEVRKDLLPGEVVI